MAQLKATTINGQLTMVSNLNMPSEVSIRAVNPVSEVASSMLHMSSSGNTMVGYGGYKNKDANTYVCGNDAYFYIASTGNSTLRPYYRAGDTISFAVRTAGYIAASGTEVRFMIPVTMPIIGSTVASAASNNGFLIRQDGKFTHGSATDTYVKADSITVEAYKGYGFYVSAKFSDTTNAVNNGAVGVYWSGTITLS